MNAFVSIFIMDSVPASLLNATLVTGFLLSSVFAIIGALRGGASGAPNTPRHAKR